MCPDEHQLAAFTAGQLPSQQAQALHAHIETCSRCAATMAALGHQRHASSQPPPSGGLSRYHRRQTIGAGGMGVVFLADDSVLQRQVALKIIRPDALGAHPGELGARFVREAQALARVNHPHVVSVFDAGFDEAEGAYIAMEYLPGRDLAAWLAQKPSRPEVVAMLLPVGQALSALHAAGLVHRDVKPSNVFLNEAGVPKLGDFGLAMPSAPDATRVTQAGMVLGTPAYMAPEQLSHGQSDPRSDQYAFFVMLLEGLIGERVTGPRAAVRLASEAREGKGLPAGLWRVLERGLHERPDARFPSMAVALDALAPHAQAKAYRRGLGRIAFTVAAICLGPGLFCGGGYIVGRATAPEPPERDSDFVFPESVQGLWFKETGESLVVTTHALSFEYGDAKHRDQRTIQLEQGSVDNHGMHLARGDIGASFAACSGDVLWRDEHLVIAMGGSTSLCQRASGTWRRDPPAKTPREPE